MKLVAAFSLLAAVEGASFSHLQDAVQSVLSNEAHSTRQPNILFVITDDQDLELDSINYTPHITKHIRDRGTFFRNHFVTTALCCPSRVSLWTGRQAHNTNVTDVNPPYGESQNNNENELKANCPGGYPKFVERGFNDDFLPVWLQNAGYDTYYTGKMFNSHTIDNYHSPHINGFNGSDFLLDPYTYSYLNSTYQRNHEPPVSHEGEHTIDVITGKALGFLDDAVDGERPFFLAVSPVAPHSNVDPNAISSGKVVMSEPIPLERHQHLFENVTVPRTANFNPEQVSNLLTVRLGGTEPFYSQAGLAGCAICLSRTNQSSSIMIISIALAYALCRAWMSWLIRL